MVGSGEARESRKARGAFFTPTGIARFVADWAIRDVSDRVLEPSTGEAVFLHQAAEVIAERGGVVAPGQLLGIDIHEESVRQAGRALSERGISADLRVGDFFAQRPGIPVNAVIGNPPYIRYQDFAGGLRARAREAAFGAGVSLSALASSWAAFTVHASTFLAEGGRMGLVLPAELLSVNYAAPVRSYLLRSFDDVRLVLFEKRVFPDVQEEVVLLLADGFRVRPRGTDHFEVVQVEDGDALSRGISSEAWSSAGDGDKWTSALGLGDALGRALESDSFGTLGQWGRLALGAVTGNNRFFALSPRRVERLGLTRADVSALCPPGSQHLRALDLTRADLRRLGAHDSPTFLFSPSAEPSPAGWSYIAEGEAVGVDSAYKCRVRTPWWRVPSQPIADLFVTYMNASSVALCANSARTRHLNSVHGLFLGEAASDVEPVLVALAALNSVTALGSEIRGRSYGGGVLKVEPREAVELPVPTPDVVKGCTDLTEAVAPVRRLLGRGEEDRARELVDALLVGIGALDEDVMERVRGAHRLLRARRRARARQA